MTSPSEHPDLHAIPLRNLHLSGSAFHALYSVGARTVGDLVRRRETGLPLGKEGDAHLSALLATWGHAAVDGSPWPSYCAALGIPVLSLGTAREGDALLALFHTAARSLSHPQTSDILIRAYGLDRGAPEPYQRKSYDLYLSRYGYNRYKASGLYLIEKALVDDAHVGDRFRFSDDMRQGMSTLKGIMSHRDAPVSEDQLDARIREAFALTSVSPALRRFLAGLLQLEYRHPTRSSPRLWTRAPGERTRKIPIATRLLRHYLTEEEPLPLDGGRLLAELNARLAAPDRLTAGEFAHLLSLLPWVEQLPDGRVQAGLHTLRGRANQAVRILSEAGTSLSLGGIYAAMGRAPMPGGKMLPGFESLVSQFYRDDRLVHVGFGRWGLRTWHLGEAATILECIDEFFALHGKPASVDDVHFDVSRRRHVRRSSIRFYLGDRQRYQAFGDKRFGLLGWAPPDPEQCAPSAEETAFIASFFPGKLGPRGTASG